MLLRYENQKKETKLQNVVIKPPPWEVIVEWILRAWNDISCGTIRKSFKSCELTTALDGDEDNQIQRLKPEENPFVAIFGDIAEATPTKKCWLMKDDVCGAVAERLRNRSRGKKFRVRALPRTSVLRWPLNVNFHRFICV